MSRSLLLVATAAATLMSASLASTAEPESKVNEARQFAIECRLVDATSGKQQAQLCPKVTVFEHQRAAFSNLVQRPFVVAVSPTADKAQKPHIEVLPEGVTIDLACHSNGQASVTLDVTIEQSKIGDVEVIKVDDQTSIQQPRMAIAKSRHFIAAKGGAPFAIPLDNQPLEKSKRWADFVIIELHGTEK
jgi:hypothetical protein